MKILHIVPTYLPARRYGGPIESVHGLCRALSRLGHEVHVFTTNVDGPYDSDVPINQAVDIEGVWVWYFPSKNLRRLYYSPLFEKVLSKKISEFDIVHLHSIYLWPTWIAARLSRKLAIPYVLSPRGMLVKNLIQRKSKFIKQLWINLIEKKNLESASAIHFTADAEREEALKFKFRYKKTFVVENGVESMASRKEDYDCQTKKILFIGRVNWKKGLDRLISAMEYLEDFTLDIVGNDEEGYKKELMEVIQQKGIQERVAFRQPVYGEGKYDLLRKASALVLTSYNENFGNIVLEAMSVGVPVIVTEEVGISGIVKQVNSGRVVSGEPVRMAEQIQDLFEDTENLRTLGNNGYVAVEQNYTWDQIAKNLNREYAFLCQEKVTVS